MKNNPAFPVNNCPFCCRTIARGEPDRRFMFFEEKEVLILQWELRRFLNNLDLPIPPEMRSIEDRFDLKKYLKNLILGLAKLNKKAQTKMKKAIGKIIDQVYRSFGISRDIFLSRLSCQM